MLRLKALRVMKGLNQKDFGVIFNAAQNTVSNWEKGIREPDSKTLSSIANYFNTNIDYLIGVGGVEGLGQDIIRQRELRGLSRKELSDEIGISEKGLLYFESDELPLYEFMIEKIAEALGMSGAEFLAESIIYNDYIPAHFKEDVNKYEDFKRAVDNDALNDPSLWEEFDSTLDVEQLRGDVTIIEDADKVLKTVDSSIIEAVDKKLTEKDILTLAAHRSGHEGALSDSDMERIKLAIQIALAKNKK